MPICPMCRIAYLDGEAHTCERKRHRAVIICICIVVTYAALAFVNGSVFSPGAIAIYLAIVAVMAIGHALAAVVHLLVG